MNKDEGSLAALRAGLIAARALIDTPEKWGRGMESFENGYAYNPPRYPICAYGACAAAVMMDGKLWDQDHYDAIQTALHLASPGMEGVAVYNDDPATTHADIMALFDRAIAKLDVQEFEPMLSPPKAAILHEHHSQLDERLRELNRLWSMNGSGL